MCWPSFRKAPQMRMIMPRDQVAWMLSLTGDVVQISEDRPPDGTRPWRTHAHALVSGVMALVLVGIVLLKGLPPTGEDLARHSVALEQAGDP